MRWRSRLLIVALWVITIAGSVMSTASMNSLAEAMDLSPAMLPVLILMPIVVLGAASLSAVYSPFYHPRLARFVDTRYGVNALERFLVRLRPLLMFAVGGGLQGVIGFTQDRASGAGPGGLVLAAFCVSANVCFALMHVVLYVRKVPGVYPTWTLRPAGTPLEDRLPRRLPLREALRRHWWNLLGLVLFPAIVTIGNRYAPGSEAFFLSAFFAVALLAAWPWMSGRAPFSYWAVACGVWLGSTGLAAGMLTLLNAVVR